MNHSWHKNTCIKCGLHREKKRAKVIQLHYAVNRQGLQEVERMKTIRMWNYEGHGFKRPDCPDNLIEAA